MKKTFLPVSSHQITRLTVVACVCLLGAYGKIATAQTLTTLWQFNGANGEKPEAGLVQGSDGNFYGTTEEGGLTNLNSGYGDGTVFKITPQGTLTTLWQFNGANGAGPNGALVQGSDGNFYGTTQFGGTNELGTVFKITSQGTLTTLWQFGADLTNGQYANALVQGTDSNFYGTTYGGGMNGDGTVFKITPQGTLTTLWQFNGANGMEVGAGLVQGADGNFYGTTILGGTNTTCGSGYGCGTVFKITPQGTLTTVLEFNGANGGNPESSLVQGTDGNFYGTTALIYGIVNGTVFKITPQGTLTTLWYFSTQVDGYFPNAVMQAADGYFYGTTAQGGTYGYGTVFMMIPSQGTLTALWQFGANPTNGTYPYSGLVQGSDGYLYGTTGSGGTNGYGTVFRILPGPYTITTSSSPSAGGSTTGGGVVNWGSNVTVTATANACYSFVNWTTNGTVVSSSPSYSFTASANETLVANFSPITYTITTSSSPSAGGSTSGGGTVNCGSNATVTATANACYSFVNWTTNGTVVSTSASYSFTPSANEALVANFSPITYTISTSSSPPAGGSTSGGGTVSCGSNVTVTATASACYSFTNWTLNGTVVSSSASYSFTASANETLVANFNALGPYTIGTSSSPAGGGTTSGGGVVNCGSNITVCATANTGYLFVDWTLNSSVVSTAACYAFTPGSNVALVANFAWNTTNSWIDINGKWETAANWSQAVAPSSGDAADLITNVGNNTVSIDATTVLSNSLNGCMTINNLTVSAPPGSANTLFLNNAGTNTPLQVLTNLTVSSGGAVVVTNASLVANLAINAGLIEANSGWVTISRTANAWASSTPTNNGVLQMSGGTLTVADVGTQNVTRAFRNNGTITGSGTLAASVLQSGSGATIASNGVLNIYGSFASGQAVYGPVSGQYGVYLAVTGGVLKVIGPITMQGGYWAVNQGGLWEIATNVTACLTNAYIPASNIQGTVLVDPGATLAFPSANAGGPFYALYGALEINGGIVSLPNAGGLHDFTNTATGVISGSGTFLTGYGQGSNNYAVVNFGTISVASGGTLTLDPEDAFDLGGVQNAPGGTMTVGSGGTLVIRRTDHAWTDVPYASYPTNLGTVYLEGGTLFGQDTSGTNYMASLYVNGASGLIHGCGTVENFATVQNNGTILGDCGGALGFTGAVTNNGSVVAINGTTLNFFGPLVNNGAIIATNGAVNFYSTFQNHGTVTGVTNSWTDGTGKWETAANWWLNSAPSTSDAADLITNAGNNTVTIDATTVLSNAVNSCLTINNLTVSAPSGTTNTLFLNNAGTVTPLRVFSVLTLGTNGAMVVDNSAAQSTNFVNISSASSSVTVTNGGSLVVTNGSRSGNVVVNAGSLIVGTGTFKTDNLIVTNGGSVQNTQTNQVDNASVTVAGGSLVATNAPTTIGSVGNSVASVVVSSNATVLTGLTSLGVGSNSTASLTLQGAPTMQVLSNLTAGSGVGSTATVSIAGGQLTATNGVIGIGNNGSTTNGFGYAQMTVSNSSVLANQILLGSSAGGHGDLTIQPNGLVSLVGSNALLVPDGVTISGGELDIDNGEIQCGGGASFPGSLTMSSGTANCMVIDVGDTSAGTLTISGGQMSVSPLMDIGYASGSAGAVWISGGTLTASVIILGDSGVGQLSLSNNGIIQVSSSFSVGACGAPGAAGTLTVAGGSLTVGVPVYVGAGSVWVSSGQLQATSLLLGYNNYGVGQLTISNGSVQANSLILTNGANSQFSMVGGTLESGGTVATNNQGFVVGNGSSAATFSMAGGTHWFGNGLEIANNATLSGCGIVNGNVTIDAGAHAIATCGTVTFSNTVTINGNGVVRALNGSVLNFTGPVVNNGAIDVLNGSAKFSSSPTGTGYILTTNCLPVVTGIKPVGTDIHISFTTGTNAPYAVNYKTDMVTGTWTPLTSVTGTGGTNSVTDSGAALQPKRFYQINLVVPP